ncbi:hypothetical protein KXD40_008438 [Peronospora effusa]|uniref:Uncharacterized protein n=1 Tax=Peronospora effusa TaxID=542832 RepID=A0A3M6VQD8_9STRA|nr:hypothetical protein DD238_002417 [Peronospora effusa]UIZ24372.1 hypothetical protein KXD40_008438 [Peronospora effusa]
MANVMLTSEAAKDPNKPFALRVEDVCTKFDVCTNNCARFRSKDDQLTMLCAFVGARIRVSHTCAVGGTIPVEREEAINGDDQVVKKLEQFNSVCDELYKEILRRKEKILNLMEKSPKNVDLHRQIQTAGNLAQVVGEFRHFLETGNDTTLVQVPQQPKE